MKKPYLKEIQAQILGSVADSKDICEYFSTDGSIFKLVPQGIIYPKNTADVRKTVKYLYERAVSGKPVGITARGKGTDQGGGALGDGVHIVFPAHMNKVIRHEKNQITVQPGIVYRSLQQTLHSHGCFLPPYPSSIDYSSIGGAVANNAAGEKTVKYGTTRNYVKSLKVVLSDGSLIETKPLNKRELSRKQGQNNLEGAIYRGVDRIIEENIDLIRERQPHTSKNTAGYALGNVWTKEKHFDLAQLIVGSQGTLGLVTEITLNTLEYNPRTTLVVGYAHDLKSVGEIVRQLQILKPSALEIVDYYLLDFLRKNRPQDLAGLVPEELPKLVILAEFDDTSQMSQTIKSRRAGKVFTKFKADIRLSTDPIEQEALWKIRHSAAAVLWMDNGSKKALPFIEDGVVPVTKLPQFLDGVYQLLAKYDLDIAVWGHAGDANLHLQPFLDLGKKKDVETLYALNRVFQAMVIKLGGSTCAEHNDGLIRGPFLKDLYGKEMYNLFVETKKIFDPQSILNPRVKLGVEESYTKTLLRSEYSVKHLYDHMPHS